MEVVNVMPDGQFVNLEEILEEVDEDNNEGLFEEEILITNEEIERGNVLQVTNEDEEENEADADTSDQDYDLAGNAHDY
jgi:hypothetical protein